MATAPVTLEDKYRLDTSHSLISGRQALVRFPIVQRELDRRRGLNTAGYISGYRGSPLGGYDDALWKASAELAEANVVFHRGVNEDLALTAVAGTQQLGFVPDPTVDGVFGIWYGKGPGVDRSGDAIKHANLQGVSPNGGVVLIYGDDHTGKSSTTAHQSDLTLASWGVPTLYPGSVAEILEMALAAVAMSRYTGLLVGLKLVNETAESTEAIDLTLRDDFIVPETPAIEGGVHIRAEALAMQRQDMRLVRHKLPMASAFARANRMDRVTFGADRAKLVIATAGKAHADVLAALRVLGIDEAFARRIGIGVYKIGLLFPLDVVALDAATAGADEILFIEEKRAHAETQAKVLLYPRTRRPRITGKTDDGDSPLLPADFPLDARTVALAIASRIEMTFPQIGEAHPDFTETLRSLRARSASARVSAPLAARRPAFCPGCPHNLSTKVPTGSIGGTGIGCHGMVGFHPERNPMPMGHMGGEGANWIGLSRFTKTRHIFQNLGDGTYNHSGSLAIRAAVDAGTNITFKILFNDAVAMTGGQPVEGGLTVAAIVAQVKAERVARVIVVSEHPERFRAEPLPAGTELRPREDLPLVQEQLRRKAGVTVLIYDQVCAAEKRRRRKIGAYPDPDRRTFINALVCEGCGDCSIASNCLAVQPLETELGRKRRIDQSACNNDFSCTTGFCPSFVTIEGARPRKAPAPKSVDETIPPDPAVPTLDSGFDLVISGIGGTGVVTVAAVLGMAARLEGLSVKLFDMTGLSQKGGAVFSHVRFRRDKDAVVAAKVGTGEANLVLACDLVAAVHPEILETISSSTRVVANANTVATAGFQSYRDLAIPTDALIRRLGEAAGRDPLLVPASELAVKSLGDSIAANMLLLGTAWQYGLIPLPLSAIRQAIELNGRAAANNLKAFNAGRRAAISAPITRNEPPSLDAFIVRRAADLARYWNAAYAARYTDLLSTVRAAVVNVPGGEAFAWAVARSAYKLMAYKDEYEVARLYSDGRFRAALDSELQDVRSLKVHLAPPLFSRIDPRTGHPRKITFGSWILPLLSVLAAMRGLRESRFDVFARSDERRLERTLRDRYETTVRRLAKQLSSERLAESVEIAEAPLNVRGFGHVKAPAAHALLARLEQPGGGTHA